MKSLEKKSSFEKIHESYISEKPVQLSAKLEQLKSAYEQAFSMMASGHSPMNTAKMLVEKGVADSRTTAYRYIRRAKDLFGDVLKSTKEGKRAMVYELAMRAYHKAEEKGDVSEMNKAISNMIKMDRLDKYDGSPIDWSKIKPNTYHIELPEATKKSLSTIISQGAVNLDSMMDVEDVPFEEVKNEEGE